MAHVDGCLHKMWAIVQMSLVEMLLHVTRVSYPKVTQDTVLRKLEANSWDATPLLPTVEAIEEF